MNNKTMMHNIWSYLAIEKSFTSLKHLFTLICLKLCSCALVNSVAPTK